MEHFDLSIGDKIIDFPEVIRGNHKKFNLYNVSKIYHNLSEALGNRSEVIIKNTEDPKAIQNSFVFIDFDKPLKLNKFWETASRKLVAKLKKD